MHCVEKPPSILTHWSGAVSPQYRTVAVESQAAAAGRFCSGVPSGSAASVTLSSTTVSP